MDFALPYTEEQERFRKEVRGWLNENVPADLKDPVDPRDFTIELNQRWREVHKALGQKGWLYPSFPKEYGGGGLSGDHETIITEEMDRAGVPSNFTSDNTLPPMQVWGTDEQKERFLKPIVTGEKTVWNKLTEPNGGADLANVQGTAVRDGDDWLLSGEHVFVSERDVSVVRRRYLCVCGTGSLKHETATVHTGSRFFNISWVFHRAGSKTQRPREVENVEEIHPDIKDHHRFVFLVSLVRRKTKFDCSKPKSDSRTSRSVFPWWW